MRALFALAIASSFGPLPEAQTWSPTRVQHSSIPSPACLPDRARLLPVGGPHAEVGESGLVGISAEWLVYTTFGVFPQGGEANHVRIYHIPTGQHVSPGFITEDAPWYTAYLPGSRYVFAIDTGELKTYDLLTHTTTATGLYSVGWLGLPADWMRPSTVGSIVFFVREASYGVDLNGNGSLLDLIPHWCDLSTGEILDCDQIADPSSQSRGHFRNDGKKAVWLTDETTTDLNGDGDLLDEVYYEHDFQTKTGSALPLASGSQTFSRLGQGFLVVTVDETNQGSDLNLDGDLSDLVVHILEPTGQIKNTMETADWIEVSNDQVLYRSPDSAGLNLLHLHTNAQTVIGAGSIDFPSVEGNLVVFAASEQAGDANGDGDTLDHTLWVHDLVTGSSYDVGHATRPVSFIGQRARWSDGRFVLFLQDEAAQGSTDLNGDGDAVDRVWGLFDLQGERVHNLRLATGGSQEGALFGEFAVLSVSESAQGQDMNGDGLLSDVTVTAATDGSQARRVLPYRLGPSPRRVPGLGVVSTTSVVFPDLRTLVIEDCPE